MKQFFFSGNLEAAVANEVLKHVTAFSWIRISECTSRKGASAGSAQEGSVQSAEECTSMHNDAEKEQGLSSFYSSSHVG